VDPANAVYVLLRKPPATSAAQAPIARIPQGEAFILKLRRLPERTSFTVQLQVNTATSRQTPRWRPLDKVRSNRKGAMDLPALDARKPGAYLVRLQGPGRMRYFVRIEVQPTLQ
jgi:hypothetical protein